MDRIRIGTASWTDPEFIKAGWYPDDVKNDAEGRLRDGDDGGVLNLDKVRAYLAAAGELFGGPS